MPSSPYRNADDAERHIQRLEEELYTVRSGIIDMMPEDVVRLLRSYSQCNQREETFEWLQHVSEALIERMRSSTCPDEARDGLRVMCPLCNQGSSAPNVVGYAFPEGLRRHLEGRGGAYRCVVTEAAFGLAQDRWSARFDKTDLKNKVLF